MQAPQAIQPPTNWQDFETLCMKLWGEIWNCPEITKNGRPGQQQFGVDISGIPSGESAYYGIQCKGKDMYTNKQITEGEILKEIENAKQFEPSLKKLYITTTAVRDAKLQTFIRKQNLENIRQGLFEVHLYSWEDISEKIFDSPKTYNYYLLNRGMHSTHNIKVSFQNDRQDIILNPIFKRAQYIPHYSRRMDSIFFSNPNHHFYPQEINLSLSEIFIKIANLGSLPLINYKLILLINGQFLDILDSNVTGGLELINAKANVHVNRDNKGLTINPFDNRMLVPHDLLVSDAIYFKTDHNNTNLTINWSFISADFSFNGELKIAIEPIVMDITEHYSVDDEVLVRAGPFTKGIEEFKLSPEAYDELKKQGFANYDMDQT